MSPTDHEDPFEHLLASLHRAALDDAHWLPAARAINEAVGTRGHSLAFAKGYSPRDGELFFARLCVGEVRRDDWERTYITDYWEHDERLPILHAVPDGVLVPTDELYTTIEKKSSVFYNEMLRDLRGQHGLNVRLDAPGESQVLWVLTDPIEAEGWSSDQVELIEGLRPHIRHYVSVRQALVDARALGVSLHGLLDNTGTGVIHLNRRGRVMEANDPARDILRERKALFAPEGFLRAVMPTENAALQRLLAAALPPFGDTGSGGSMTARGTSSSTKLILHVSPVGAESRSRRTRRVAALVLAVDPGNAVRLDPHLVAQALGLTPTESRLAIMLAAGHSVAEIAEATGRKKKTVHWHLQHIFRKLGLARQAELVRYLSSLQVLPGSRHREHDP